MLILWFVIISSRNLNETMRFLMRLQKDYQRLNVDNTDLGSTVEYHLKNNGIRFIMKINVSALWKIAKHNFIY